MTKLPCPVDINLFSEADHLIVRQAMALLPRRQLKAVTLRFWERLSETEITIAMNTDWQTVERLINNAFTFLSETCLAQPDFSRSRLKAQEAPQRIPNQDFKCSGGAVSYGN